MVVRKFPSRYALLTMLVGSVLALVSLWLPGYGRGRFYDRSCMARSCRRCHPQLHLCASSEVIVESLRAMEAKQHETEQADRHKKIAARQANLLQDPMSASQRESDR